MLKRFFKRTPDPAPRIWTAPVGRRLYAIGDIHGRRDLLDALLAKIDEDDATRGSAQTTLVILGDLPDRGADSKGVIERLIQLKAAGGDIIFLMGNHEELFIRIWEGEREIAATFNRAGGRATMLSYGVSPQEYDAWDLGDLAANAHKFVPEAHIAFLRSFQDWYKAGDYLFVHAGIAPGIAIEDQSSEDMRWIRRAFVESEMDHGVMVIHGHTITPEVDEKPNRIGIDTGAYASGKLTAIGIEGSDRWFLST